MNSLYICIIHFVVTYRSFLAVGFLNQNHGNLKKT